MTSWSPYSITGRIKRRGNRRQLHEFTTAVRRFNELHGTIPAVQIRKSHVVAFKDKLVADGLTRGTIVKQLGALSAVLQLAVDNDKLPLNPARGVRLPKSKGGCGCGA